LGVFSLVNAGNIGHDFSEYAGLGANSQMGGNVNEKTPVYQFSSAGKMF
jgi:hypothetical protein